MTGHAVRGIGRYLTGILDAVGSVGPGPRRASLGVLVLPGQVLPLDAPTWTTHRAPVRPQDLDLVVAPIADRIALRRRRPLAWHHTDPSNPWSPLPAERTIVTVYDLIPLREPAMMERIRWHRRLAYRHYLGQIRAAAGVIAISAASAADVVELLGVPGERIRVVPPFIAATGAVDAGVAPPVATHLARYLFVGIPEPHKRPLLAIDALAALVRRGVDAELTFAGIHPPRLRAELQKRIGEAGVRDRVQFLDRIDDADLSRRYRESILVATSSIEGFGLPLVEAILAGGVVAATPIAAYREAVGDVATFAADDTVAAMADAMEAARDRPISANERARLSERFSAATVSTALLDAYHDLVGA
jgi:glycosyltransferase involved in cell wall biosynthesis